MDEEEIYGIIEAVKGLLREQDGGEMPPAQEAVLFGSLKDPKLTYDGLARRVSEADARPYTGASLKTAGYQLFNRLNKCLPKNIGKVRKTNCRTALQRWFRNWSDSEEKTTGAVSRPHVNNTWVDDLLRQIRKGYRVVFIAGPPGTGKTRVITTLYDGNLSGDFQGSAWWPASVSIPFEEFCGDVVQQISQTVELDDSFHNMPASRILKLLIRRYSLLLTVVQSEELYRSDCLAGVFSTEASRYQRWLREFLEDPQNKSCLVWSGWETPSCFPSTSPQLYHYQVPEDLSEENTSLVSNKFIYPFWLSDQQDSSSEKNLFRKLLRRLTFSEIRLLESILLLPEEKRQKRDWCVPDVLPGKVPEILESLERRKLISCSVYGYTLNSNVLIKVLLEELVDTLEAAFIDKDLSVLGQYPLLSPCPTFGHYGWQKRQIILPLAKRIQRRFRKGQRKKMFTDLLSKCREALDENDYGYAPGNLLVIAAALNPSLSGFDIQNLKIHKVDLSQIQLNFLCTKNAIFSDCCFPLGFVDPSDRAMILSQDGYMLSVGDSKGKIICWRRNNQDQWALYRLAEMREPIQILDCYERDVLIIGTKDSVYRWILDDAHGMPELMFRSSKPISSLKAGSRSYIAAGLTNGQILVWSHVLEKEVYLDGHSKPIWSLAFSYDSNSLVSFGYDERVLIWRLDDPRVKPQVCAELTDDRWIVILGAAWIDNTLLQVGGASNQVYLRKGNEPWSLFRTEDSRVMEATLSPNGCYIAIVNDKNSVWCGSLDSKHATCIGPFTICPSQVSINNDGRWLLVRIFNPDNVAVSIQLWDMCNQRKAWEVEIPRNDRGFYGGACFREVRGLSVIEEKLIKSLLVESSESDGKDLTA